jgi:Protein of unknown function (DUF2958)
MKLLLGTQRVQLLANCKANTLRRNNGLDEIDFPPVVKLFTLDGGATWLITEINSDEPDIAFGLCDLGMGCEVTSESVEARARRRILLGDLTPQAQSLGEKEDTSWRKGSRLHQNHRPAVPGNG